MMKQTLDTDSNDPTAATSEKPESSPDCKTDNKTKPNTTSASKTVILSSSSSSSSASSSSSSTSISSDLSFPISSKNPRYEAALKRFNETKVLNEKTKKQLEEATIRLDEAQKTYNEALSNDQKTNISFTKAQEEMNTLDLLLPGQWNTMYHKLVAYKEKYGHCEVSQDGCFGKEKKTNQTRRKPVISEDDKVKPDFQKLARWVGNQRVFYKYFQNGDKKHIKAHRIAALDKLGFIWDVKEHRWLEKYNQLKEFRINNGHTDVPKRENKDLHDWAVRQRREFVRKREGIPYSLSCERIRLLEDLQFDFNVTKSVHGGNKSKSVTPDSLWEEKHAELMNFHEKYGHTQVNLRSMNKTHSLTRWVAYLRNQYIALQEGKPSVLTSERISSLEALDFQWKKPSSLPRRNCGRKKRKGGESDDTSVKRRAPNKFSKDSKIKVINNMDELPNAISPGTSVTL